MTKTIQKNKTTSLETQRKQSLDIAAWEGLAGILRGKKIGDPVKWQRKIRKELERKLA